VAIVAGKPELADSLTRGYGVKFYTLAAVSDDNLQKHAMVGCSFSTVTSAWDTASVPSASAVWRHCLKPYLSTTDDLTFGIKLCITELSDEYWTVC